MLKVIFGRPIIFIIAIVILAAILMFKSALEESAIMDELAHIPAGYGYVKYLDSRLNPEHPPLLKALSALPLLALDLKFPTDQKSWTEDINGQWEAGNQFLYTLGNNADEIIMRTRIFPILLTLLTVVLIYIWAKELLGKWWALVPAFLFGLSPTTLAHGRYVTTDMAATFGVIFATYLFLKFLLQPSRAKLFWAGIGLGVAELAKFSLAMLFPYFLILTLIFIFTRIRTKSRWYYLRSLLLIFFIAMVTVYLVYLPLTWNYPQEKQTADTIAILNSFTPRFLADFTAALTQNPISRPFAHYLFGLLMVLQRATGGNTVYFLGEVSATGSSFYFPLVFLMKETLPALLLIFSALIFGLFRIGKNNLRKPIRDFKNYLETNFAEFAMLFFIIIYWAYSIKSNLNIGIRHLLPTFPFIYILAIGSLKILRKRTAKIFIILMALWQIGGIIITYPNFLSYFNEAAGGANYGYRYVTDSNYDWGQDLKRLKKWTDENDIQQIAVDYFGGGNPKYYLGEVHENWRSSKGNPKDSGIEWLAVSINTLQGAFGKLHPDQQRSPDDEYRWLEDVRPRPPGLGQVPAPDFRIGKSIFVYHL